MQNSLLVDQALKLHIQHWSEYHYPKLWLCQSSNSVKHNVIVPATDMTSLGNHHHHQIKSSVSQPSQCRSVPWVVRFFHPRPLAFYSNTVPRAPRALRCTPIVHLAPPFQGTRPPYPHGLLLLHRRRLCTTCSHSLPPLDGSARRQCRSHPHRSLRLPSSPYLLQQARMSSPSPHPASLLSIRATASTSVVPNSTSPPPASLLPVRAQASAAIVPIQTPSSLYVYMPHESI